MTGKKKRRIRAVFLDLDDTLFDVTRFAALARRAAVDAMRRSGVDLPRTALLRELEEIVREFSPNDNRHFNKLLMRIPKNSLGPLQPSLIVAAAVRAYHDAKRENLKPFPGTLPTLRRLARRKNLIRGIITHGRTNKQSEKLVRLGIVPFLTPGAVFITESAGIAKVNPKLFLLACETCGVSPRETLFVGDRLTHDILPAGSAGMVTVHFYRPEAKHAGETVRKRPDFTISRLNDLLSLLDKHFQVPS